MRGLPLLIMGLIAYVATLFFSNAILTHHISDPIRILAVLLPMLPVTFICSAIFYAIRKLDEFQRKLQFEALAFSFTGTALMTFSYGFLEGVGFPKISMFAIWPLMGGLWFVGIMIGRLRFR